MNADIIMMGLLVGLFLSIPLLGALISMWLDNKEG